MYPTHFLTIAGLLIATLIAPSEAMAQDFDRARYDEVAEVCVEHLRNAQAAMEREDSTTTWSYAQLADTPCQEARELLAIAITSGSLSTRHRRILIGDYVAQESAWIMIATWMGRCDDGQVWLTEMTALVPEIPEDVQQRFIGATQAVLTCTPAAVAAPTPVVPTPTPAVPTPASGSVYGAVTIGSGWSPQSYSGMGGGPDSANLRFAGTCNGYITSIPTFTLEVIDYTTVSVEALAAGDLTMVLTGPGGTFCNDDFNGLNPGLSQSLMPGSYQVWIGEYAASAGGTSFTVTFSANVLVPPAAVVPPPTPTYGGGTLCFNSCGEGNAWVGDGDCDDGGPGSDYALCTYGNDCTDCGPRPPQGGSVPPPTLCFNSCGEGNAWVGDGDCDDGGPGSAYALCTYGYDCIDCGPRAPR
jgi:hypothetical protein